MRYQPLQMGLAIFMAIAALAVLLQAYFGFTTEQRQWYGVLLFVFAVFVALMLVVPHIKNGDKKSLSDESEADEADEGGAIKKPVEEERA